VGIGILTGDIYSQTRCSFNFARHIALSNLRALLQAEIHKRFVNKPSDWTIRKRKTPIQLLRLFDWLPFYLLSSQRLCLQIFCEFQLATVLASLANYSEQYMGQYCNVACKRTSDLTVMCLFSHFKTKWMLVMMGKMRKVMKWMMTMLRKLQVIKTVLITCLPSQKSVHHC
jgi:hypothetical protein